MNVLSLQWSFWWVEYWVKYMDTTYWPPVSGYLAYFTARTALYVWSGYYTYCPPESLSPCLCLWGPLQPSSLPCPQTTKPQAIQPCHLHQFHPQAFLLQTGSRGCYFLSRSIKDKSQIAEREFHDSREERGHCPLPTFTFVLEPKVSLKWHSPSVKVKAGHHLAGSEAENQNRIRWPGIQIQWRFPLRVFWRLTQVRSKVGSSEHRFCQVSSPGATKDPQASGE